MEEGLSLGQRIEYEKGVADAIACVSRLTSHMPASDMLPVFAGLKDLLPSKSARVHTPENNYLENVQALVRKKWREMHGIGSGKFDVHYDAVAGVDTPLGRLKAITWKRKWTGKRGERIIWATEYYLDDEPVTIDELRKAGLAMGIKKRRAEAGILSRRQAQALRRAAREAAAEAGVKHLVPLPLVTPPHQ